MFDIDFGQAVEFLVLSVLVYLGLKTYFSEATIEPSPTDKSDVIIQSIRDGLGAENYQPMFFERATTVGLDLPLMQNGTYGNAVIEKMQMHVTSRGYVRIDPKDILITPTPVAQNSFVVGVVKIDVVFNQQVIVNPLRQMDITEIIAAKVCKAYQEADNCAHLLGFNLSDMLVLDDLHLQALDVLGQKLKDLSNTQDATFGFAQELPTVCNIYYVDSSGNEQLIQYSDIQDAREKSVRIQSSLVGSITETDISRTPYKVTTCNPAVSVNLLAPMSA
jgi:hypothetical protein